MRTRAERRHLRQRAVAYARRKLKQWGIHPKHAPLWADNMAKCDCWMCNGKAKHTKPAKTLIDDNDYADEFDWNA